MTSVADGEHAENDQAKGSDISGGAKIDPITALQDGIGKSYRIRDTTFNIASATSDLILSLC